MNPNVFEELKRANTLLENNFKTYSNKIVGRTKKWDQFDKQYPKFKLIQNLVNLNVGGYRFTVSEEVLYSEPSSNLKQIIADSFKICSNNNNINNKNGEIFIDRPGKNFSFLLQYLRTKESNSNNLTLNQKIEIIDECYYYGVNITI